MSHPLPFPCRPARSSTLRRRRSVGLLLGLALLLAGCRGSTAEVDDPPAGGDDASDVVEVTAVDFGFEGLPDEVSAGTTLALRNDAPTELHELVAIRLPDDEERSADELLALPHDELDALLSSTPPTAVLLAPPGDGEQIEAVGDGTLDEPGRYLVLCSIPTGASVDGYLAAAAESQGGPPQVPGGPPHHQMGMYALVTVTA